MGAVVSPSGGACEHVNIIDDTTGDVLGTITTEEYGEIVGVEMDTWTPESATNRATIEVNLEQDLAAMQTIIDTANATINASPAAHIKAIARNLRRLDRIALGQYDGTD
jgi:hypothetical protein